MIAGDLPIHAAACLLGVLLVHVSAIPICLRFTGYFNSSSSSSMSNTMFHFARCCFLLALLITGPGFLLEATLRLTNAIRAAETTLHSYPRDSPTVFGIAPFTCPAVVPLILEPNQCHSPDRAHQSFYYYMHLSPMPRQIYIDLPRDFLHLFTKPLPPCAATMWSRLAMATILRDLYTIDWRSPFLRHHDHDHDDDTKGTLHLQFEEFAEGQFAALLRDDGARHRRVRVLHAMPTKSTSNFSYIVNTTTSVVAPVRALRLAHLSRKILISTSSHRHLNLSDPSLLAVITPRKMALLHAYSFYHFAFWRFTSRLGDEDDDDLPPSLWTDMTTKSLARLPLLMWPASLFCDQVDSFSPITCSREIGEKKWARAHGKGTPMSWALRYPQTASVLAFLFIETLVNMTIYLLISLMVLVPVMCAAAF
jgi:hypothetical protein